MWIQRIKSKIKESKKITILAVVVVFIITAVGFSFAQGLFSSPRYPSRITSIAKELSQAGEDLSYLNNDLKQMTEACDCKNAQSQCFQKDTSSCETVGVKTFGETCLERKEIQKRDQEIRDRIDQINYLNDLLQKEMANGLEEELATLPDNEAEQLRTALENIIRESEEIIAPAQKNIDILNNKDYLASQQCSASCEKKSSLKINACISKTLGQQNPITLNVVVGASLEKIDLGKIEINELSLNLPNKIDLGGLGKISELRIPMPDANVSFLLDADRNFSSLEIGSVFLQPSISSLPKLPSMDFSCPQTNNKTYQCSKTEKGTNLYTNLEWHLQTFSWLSDKCQSLPGLNDENGLPNQEKYEKCFAEETAHTTIINQCDSLWQTYLACKNNPMINCPAPSGICSEISYTGNKTQPIARECQSLFQAEGESVPANCNLNVLENKCKQLKEANRENIPDQCKFLPLFNGSFENPETQIFQEATSSCPSQAISDSSGVNLSPSCLLSSYSQPSSPSIKLPDLIIPDIQLPTFNFSPFAIVKLPNFIFEDLVFPEMEFCKLDNCLDTLSSLNIEMPSPVLRIPAIEIPSIKIFIPNSSGTEAIPVDINMGKLDIPSIPISIPPLDLARLISLDIQMPEISMPSPKIILDFNSAGLNIDFSDLLLGMVSSFIKIPSGCLSASVPGIPINLSYPDYYFSWPKFPEVPDLCNNQYMSIQNFCSKINNSLGSSGVLNNKNKIQQIINTATQNIQEKLDNVANAYQEVITEYLSKNMDKISAKIEGEIRKAIAGSSDSLNLNSLNIPLDDILIPVDKINSALAKIPLEIPLSWPSELKKIKLSNPISYSLPSIPIDGLSYLRKKEFKLPGLQLPSLDFSLDLLGNYSSCKGVSPSGGNPYPINEINVNINELTKLKSEISNSSKEISEILE